ncbi:MAG: SDR family oxidoreductase [Gammaproteobacteria bacterium]|nr:SDR family oxidoreductase [Gammaproteobacteria bacterium]
MQRVAVTGANRGIGLEIVRQLQHRDDEVIAICRQSSDELEQTGARIVADIDVGESAGVEHLAREAGSAPLDMLINNAGILQSETLGTEGWEDSVRRQFEINALGPLRVTLALSRLLGGGSKVGIVSSRVGSLADNSSGGNYGYRMSKAAVNMAGVNLAHELRSREIAVFLLHPGYVRTGMTGGGGSKDASSAGRELIALMDRLTLADTGTFWHADGYQLPW